MTVLAAVLLIGLAAARVTRFLVSDDLLEPWRSGWLLARFPPTPPGPPAEVELTERRWRHKLGDLASCVFCTGWWVSGGMLAVAHAAGLVDWPLRWDLVLWWAVATVQVLANLLMERLGQVALPRITDGLHDDPACPYCRGEGMVCEDHPGRPWGPMVEGTDAVIEKMRAVSEASDDGRVTSAAWVQPADALGPLGGCWCGAPGMPCPRVPG